MGKILLHSSEINDSNIQVQIEGVNPAILATSKLRELCRYFSATLISKAEDIVDAYGDSEVSKNYMDVAASLAVIFDMRSLQKFGLENHDSISQLYMREKSFRAFVGKFLPELMTVSERVNSRLPEVEEGKITRFPSHAARLIQASLAENLPSR